MLDHPGVRNQIALADPSVGPTSGTEDRERENNMQVTMKDRVAVVTGGSKGLGIAVARRFAGSGAKVAILARGAKT